MKIKIFLAICISLILVSSGSSVAFAVTTLDFDSLATGYYAEGALSGLFSGVSFNNSTGAGFDVTGTSIGLISLLADFSGNAIINNPYAAVGNSTIAAFTQNADFVSVTMGDYNADADELYLRAFNSSNGLINSSQFSNPNTSYAGQTLSVSDPTGSIAYVEFYGVGANEHNSIFWDNFSYNTYERTGGSAPTVVPEPSSLLLLGFGLLGFLKKKFKK